MDNYFSGDQHGALCTFVTTKDTYKGQLADKPRVNPSPPFLMKKMLFHMVLPCSMPSVEVFASLQAEGQRLYLGLPPIPPPPFPTSPRVL